MGGNLSLSGSLVVGGGCGGCNDASAKVQALELGCRQTYTGPVVSSDTPFSVNSPSAFVDLPLLGQLSAVELLFLKSNNPLVLRVDAEVAELEGSGGTFPTGFVGAETLIAKVDAYASFTTTFTSGDQSASQVAARINAAAMLAGYPFLPVSVSLITGQLVFAGKATGGDGQVLVTGGTGQDDLGFDSGTNDEAFGSGSDIFVNGQLLVEFDKQNAPERIMVKGTSSEVTLLATGPSATG